MEPIHYVGMVAQILTYASFLSGAKVCHQIYKQRSCANFSPAPFLAGLNCTILWLRYGFVADEWEIIAVNSVGLVCQVVYLAFFVVYSRQKTRLLKQLIALILFVGTLLWSVDHSVDPKFLIGSYASLSSSLACASPLATIQDVLKTKCVASLPFPIIASSFVVSLSWLVFGILKVDSFIIFSNLVAISITGAQLVLFLIYPSTLPYEKLSPSNKKSYVSIHYFSIVRNYTRSLFRSNRVLLRERGSVRVKVSPSPFHFDENRAQPLK
jgi:solute carrier family 50 protein (sugar transporter)